ncbi:MAG: alpha/beta fold hydrolase [Gemmatimonadota bacterium]
MRQCSAYAVDLFGYGESDRPFDADFGLRAQADYIDRAMTALQLTKVTLVGMDIGGIVALRVAAERRDRVSRVMLIGPPALTDLPGEEIRDLLKARGGATLFGCRAGSSGPRRCSPPSSRPRWHRRATCPACWWGATWRRFSGATGPITSSRWPERWKRTRSTTWSWPRCGRQPSWCGGRATGGAPRGWRRGTSGSSRTRDTSMSTRRGGWSPRRRRTSSWSSSAASSRRNRPR